jgi:xanthine/uracil/vitamin C permease (AzgA family)
LKIVAGNLFFTRSERIACSHNTLMMGLYANNPILVTFLIGLAVTSLLVIKRVKGALIIGIAATTILALPI